MPVAIGLTDDPGHKGFRLGTDRTVNPADTVARLLPLLSALGITRVANVTGLDRIGVPVVMVCRPNSRSLAVSQGKGLSLAAAKASGIMEAAELFHAERIDRPLRLGSHAELSATHRLVDPDQLPRPSGSRWRRDLPILWIEAFDLIGHESVWVPYEVVHANYTHPLPTGSRCFSASTNGLASGNHLLEAICHGICEVVERDATGLWHLLAKPGRDATRVDLRTVADAACRTVLDRLAQADLGVAVWDTTTDVAVPSFHCIVIDERAGGGHDGVGAGCHPVREIALLRALTEAVQVRNTYITGSRDDLTAAEYERAKREERQRRVRLLTRCDGPGRDFSTISDYRSESFADDLRWLLGRLQAVGIRQVLAVDLTKPAFGLPVARIVIPGLEGPHDDDGYVPGARARAAGARAS